MTHIEDETLETEEVASEERPYTVDIPMDWIELMFEPWDELDGKIARLEEEIKKGTADVRQIVTSIVAARDALRGPLYAVMRIYRAVEYGWDEEPE